MAHKCLTVLDILNSPDCIDDFKDVTAADRLALRAQVAAYRFAVRDVGLRQQENAHALRALAEVKRASDQLEPSMEVRHRILRAAKSAGRGYLAGLAKLLTEDAKPGRWSNR